MCDGGAAPSAAGDALVVPVDLDAFTGERIPLEPVERVRITTLVDNVCDMLAADDGPGEPAGRWPAGRGGGGRGVEDGHGARGPLAEHGFSALVAVDRPAARSTGCSSTPACRRTAWPTTCGAWIAPDDIEVVVCSPRPLRPRRRASRAWPGCAVGPALPVVIHP